MPTARARSSLSANRSTPTTWTSSWASAVRTRGHPDTTQSHDGDRLAGPRPAGVENCAAAGQHGTTQQRRDHRRNVGVDGHDRSAVDDGVVGEAGDPEVMHHRLARRGSTGCRRPSGCRRRWRRCRAGREPARRSHSRRTARTAAERSARPVGRRPDPTRRRRVRPRLPLRGRAASAPAAPGCRRSRTGPSGTTRPPPRAPAARRRPGGARSRSVIVKGSEVAYGRGSPMRSRTAPRIFIGPSLPWLPNYGHD